MDCVGDEEEEEEDVELNDDNDDNSNSSVSMQFIKDTSASEPIFFVFLTNSAVAQM